MFAYFTVFLLKLKPRDGLIPHLRRPVASKQYLETSTTGRDDILNGRSVEVSYLG